MNDMDTQVIALDQLEAHPSNSNVMPAGYLDKLAGHIERSGRYPPLIVRPLDAGRFQILDGHHRVLALRRLGRTEAQCVVWAVDDAEALVLLATLNRLEGTDDPRKRGALIAELAKLPGLDASTLALQLPEQAEDLQRLMVLAQRAPAPRPPKALADMPVAVHFFLLPAQKRELEAALDRFKGDDGQGAREHALMTMVQQVMAPATQRQTASVAGEPG
jgi:hypothetical protein